MHLKLNSFANQINWNYAFIIFTLLFIACKIPYLNMAYFYDECWSYSPALRRMSEGNISILPGAIDVESYRGHPLLFYSLAGIWLKIFGTSFIAMHSYGLLYGIALLLIVFLIIKEFINPILAFFSTVIIATQGFFIIQSSTIMPEIAVTFWVVLSFFFYLKQKWFGYLIACSCLLLTKESGAVLLPALLVSYTVLNIFSKKDTITKWFVNCIKICLPAIPLICFFILQYQKYGWFFFPEHMGYLNYEFGFIK